MSEFVNSSEQTVTSGANVIYAEDIIPCSKCIIRRKGSGIITLRGLTNGQCNARFLVSFGGNIAIPTGGDVQEISLSLAINGETIQSSVMRVVPAAVNSYFNVSTSSYIVVPSGCCQSIAIENTSGQDVLVEGANLIVTRVA